MSGRQCHTAMAIISAWSGADLLHCEEHGAVPGSQTGKVGQETIVEGQKPSTPEALHKAVQHSAVLSSLVTCVIAHF